MRYNNSKQQSGISLKQSGFTLIEAMLAVGIFSIGILAVNFMLTTTTQGNATANKVSTATAWAKRQAEEIMTWDYDDTCLTNVTELNKVDCNLSTDVDTLYTITMTLTENLPINSETSARTKVVEILVNKNDNPLNEDFRLFLIKSNN